MKTPSGRSPLWDKGPNDRRLLRFLAAHCVVGLGAGILFSALILAFDIAHLRTLMGGAREGALALFMFVFATSFLFGSMAMGIGVMLLPRDMNYGRNAGRSGAGVEGPEERPD